jgi:ketosteroid isomerase-like protein
VNDTQPAARFRECVERGDLDAAADLFAEDAVFNTYSAATALRDRMAALLSG